MPTQGSVSLGFQSPPMMPQSSIFTPPTLRFTQYPRSGANRNFQFTRAGGGKGRMTGALTWPACHRTCSGTTPRRCDRPAPGMGSPRPPAQGELEGIEGRGLGLGRERHRSSGRQGWSADHPFVYISNILPSLSLSFFSRQAPPHAPGRLLAGPHEGERRGREDRAKAATRGTDL